MPVLRNSNKDNIVINKRVAKAALKQASQYLPDVPAPDTDDSVVSSFTHLMKSFSYISLIFKQVLTIAESYHAKLQREADEEMSRMSGVYDDNDDGSDADSVSLDSAFFRGNTPQGRAARRGDSSSNSSRSSNPFFRGNTPKGKASRNDVSFRNSPPASFGVSPVESRNTSASTLGNRRLDFSSVNSTPQHARRNRIAPHPDDDDEDEEDDDDDDHDDGADDDDDDVSSLSWSRRQPITIKIIDTLNVNSLEKETVNVSFYVHMLDGQFGSLDKMKKRKLMIICQTILNQMREIVEYYPDVTHIYDQLINIFDSLKESIKTIESELKQAGELGFTGAGLISGSTTSMTGSGISHSIMRSHAPSKYVNQNFNYNLQKRNN